MTGKQHQDKASIKQRISAAISYLQGAQIHLDDPADLEQVETHLAIALVRIQLAQERLANYKRSFAAPGSGEPRRG